MPDPIKTFAGLADAIQERGDTRPSALGQFPNAHLGRVQSGTNARPLADKRLTIATHAAALERAVKPAKNGSKEITLSAIITRHLGRKFGGLRLGQIRVAALYFLASCALALAVFLAMGG